MAKSDGWLLLAERLSLWQIFCFIISKSISKANNNKKGLQIKICNPLIFMVELRGIEPRTF
jgi:hypothetical protein